MHYFSSFLFPFHIYITLFGWHFCVPKQQRVLSWRSFYGVLALGFALRVVAESPIPALTFLPQFLIALISMFIRL